MVNPDKYKKKRVLNELNTIIEIGHSIISSFDYDSVLQTISDGMSRLLQIESAAIYILENEQELWLGATTPPLNPDMPEALRKAWLEDHPHVKRAINGLKPVVLDDTLTADLSPAESMVVKLRNLRSLLYLPFVQQNEAIGVLILGTCKRSRKFTNHEVALAQTVANQLAIAIQNARLHSNILNYKNNLEKLVVERTCELKAANEELKSINEELNKKNELISKQKSELEDALHNLKTVQMKLFEAEKMASLGVLTAGVAHEINNPLNFIMGAYLGLNNFFTIELPDYLEKVSPLLGSMKLGIDRVTAIVRGLNQFSKDSKELNDDCNIHAIVDNCLLILQNQYKDRIQIQKMYADSDIRIKGNIGKLHQVFTNILLNAIQAIENQGEIIVVTELNNQHAVISIQDNGCGIEKNILPRITEPFFTTKSPQQGTGLGLSIAYKIVNEHKGSIKFFSEVKKGTTVVVSLPLVN